jgi:predicted aconitase with swiveling domain
MHALKCFNAFVKVKDQMQAGKAMVVDAAAKALAPVAVVGAIPMAHVARAKQTLTAMQASRWTMTAQDRTKTSPHATMTAAPRKDADDTVATPI